MMIKRLILLTIGLLIPLLNFGQSELAIINDSDGYVNVRADKNADSAIITTIKEGEIFLCEPSSGNWWKVKVNLFYSQTGFVHRSGIKLIKNLADKELRELILKSINGLKNYRLQYDSLRPILPNDKRMELLIEFENYEETIYTPLLPFLSKIFCKNRDVDLLDNYLRIMIINQMSANEMPAWSLADCYLCYPDLVIEQINNYSSKEKEYLWSMLMFGFENVTWQKEDEIDNFQELKNKLND